MKRIGKIITWVIAIVVLVVLVAALFTQTSFFRNMVRSKVVASINKILDADFSIARIQGNLINHIELVDVRLVRENDTIAYINRVDVGLNPIRLLDKRIQIDSLVVDSMVAIVRQLRDSSWNIAGLFKQDTAILRDTTRDTTPFAYTIKIDDFVLRRASARVVALDTAMPRRFDNILLHFSADYEEEKQRLELKELQFETVDPSFRLEKLGLVATRSGDSLSVTDLVIQTRQNRIEGEGEFDPGTPREGSAKISSAPIQLAEFQRFLPDINLPLNPQLTFDGRLVKDTLFAKLGLHVTDQSVDFDVAAYPISKALNSRTIDQVTYRLNGSLNNIDVARWSGDTTFAYDLNGTFKLNGHGVSPETMVASFSADLSDCLVLGRQVRQAIWDVDYDQGNMEGTMRFAGAFGDINFDAITIDLLHTQKYKASFSTRNLDLALLFNDEKLKSDLNLVVVANGTGFEPSRANGHVRFTIDTSKMYDFVADTGFANIGFSPEDYLIDTAFVSSPYGTFDMAGRLSSRNEGELKYVARVADLRKLNDFLKADTLAGAAVVTGTATGSMDSLVTKGEFRSAGIVYNDMRVDSALGQFDIARVDTVLTGSAKVSLDNITYSTYFVDTAFSDLKFTDSGLTASTDFAYGDSVTGRIDTRIVQGQIPEYIIPHAEFTLYDQHWSGGSNQTAIRMNGDSYEIAHLELTGDNGQRLAVDGRFSMTGTEDLRLDVTALNISPLARLLGYEFPVGGLLTANVALTGTAARPAFEGRVDMAQGRINRFTYDAWTSTFAYEPGNFTLSGQLVPTADASMTVEGSMPVNLSFTDTSGTLIDRSGPVQLKVDISKVPLTVLEALGEETQTTGGWIDGSVTLKGSMNEPDMAGRVDVHEGGFKVERLGIEYTDFEMALLFDNNSIRLDSLRIARGKGFMRATGHVDFTGGLMAGTISTTEIDWYSKQFYLARHRNFEIELTGKASLQGSTAEPRFSGDITIGRSRIYIPILSDEAMQGAKEVTRPPLLVQATEPGQYVADTMSAMSDSAAGEGMMKSLGFYQNLRGDITLNIPRNTWLTGPDMNIEIGGDLKLVKNSPEDFEIFGPIRIVRGKYSLYGKRFAIREGTLSFTGGAEINPDIDMNAEYVFRGQDRQKRLLAVHATGKAFQPTLAFTLDGADVPERDAIAYVVFGRSMAEVTGPGGGGQGFEGTKFAEGAAASALASQLAKTLGQRFALDVIEINSGGSFEAATVTVGKYITNDLFMSYQRGLGEASRDEMSPAIVTLEYELTKHLSAQLIAGESETSGADFIFKIDH